MATTVAELQARLSADTRDFDRGMGHAEGRMGKGAKMLGKLAIAGGAAVGAGLAVGAYKAIGAASDLGESVNAVNVVFGKASKQVLAFSEVAAQKAGLSMTQFNELVTPVGAALQNVGFAADDAAKASISLAQRAADMASVFNVDVSEAMGAIQAGLRGEADPLERFGVGLSEAALKAYALKTGMKLAGGELTAQQKVQARLALIMEQSNKVAGDFENTSDSLANQQRILKAEFANVTAQIGTALLPIATKIMGVLARFGQWAAPLVTRAVDFLAEAITGLIAPFTKASETFGHTGNEAYKAGRRIKDAFDAVWAFIKTNLIPIVLDLRDIFRAAIERIAKVLSDHEPELRRIFGRIGAVIKFLAKIILPILRVAFVEILPRILAVVITFVDKATFWLGKIITFVRDMRSRIATAAEGIRKFFGPGGQFRAPFTAIAEWVKARVDQMVTFFRNLPDRMGDAIRERAVALKNAVTDILKKALPGWAEDALGISSPSKVFERIGGAIVDGLVKGIRSKSGDLRDAALALLGSGETAFLKLGQQAAGGSWKLLADFAKSQGWPVTSGLRPGDPGLHGQGKAIDIDAGGIAENTRVFYTLLGAFAGRINELFFDPIGWYIDQGRRRSGAIGDHMDHVHIGLFDKGGWLKPGWTLAGNFTGRPEPVGAAAAGPYVIVLEADGQTLMRWIRKADGVYRRRGG